MKRKSAVIGCCLLLLSGCRLIQREDPQPDRVQTSIVEDLHQVIEDLGGFQKSQDDIEDVSLLDN
jgi:hypothetical protein